MMLKEGRSSSIPLGNVHFPNLAQQIRVTCFTKHCETRNTEARNLIIQLDKISGLSTSQNFLCDLGCLESPETTGANARIIKAVPDTGSSFFTELIHKLLSYIACIIFLPISISVRAATMILGIQNWIFSRGSEMESKVVLITGASSGLGEALAHTFYSEGCKLILCARYTNFSLELS